MKILDKNMFGSNPSEINLTKILYEIGSPHLTRRIALTIQLTSDLHKSVKPKNRAQAMLFYKSLRVMLYRMIDDICILPEMNKAVETHAKTAITIRLRKAFIIPFKKLLVKKETKCLNQSIR